MGKTIQKEQEQAVLRFAVDNGRSWKSKLNAAWINGSDAYEPDGCYLRQVRNQFGPSWLVKYHPGKGHI